MDAIANRSLLQTPLLGYHICSQQRARSLYVRDLYAIWEASSEIQRFHMFLKLLLYLWMQMPLIIPANSNAKEKAVKTKKKTYL